MTTVLNGLRYADLFSGIGGFRLALDSFGAKCVFSSEKDAAARKIYVLNYGDQPDGDITQVRESDLPKGIDIVCAGWPCQSFSQAGDQKGFNDARGTLFFDIVRIAQFHKPKMLLLENVSNIVSHDGGKTFKIILETLRNIGYVVYYKLICASGYGIPHARERIYILAFRTDISPSDFKYPNPTNADVVLSDILLPADQTKQYEIDVSGRGLKLDLSLLPQFRILKPYKIGYVNQGRQGERIYHPMGHAITLNAGGGNIGRHTGLYYVDGKIRKLAPLECVRLMGFPESFRLHPSKSQSYHQLGNSVIIDIVQRILISVIEQEILT